MSELEKLQDKMYQIKTWIDAYPLKIFPEPDFKKAHKILKQHGITLDAISASNMRHVLKGIKEIIDRQQSVGADPEEVCPACASKKVRHRCGGCGQVW